MRINAKVEYQVVWGDYGVEYHNKSDIMSCKHSSSEAVREIMESVLREWKDFLDYHADEYARIYWLSVGWKLDGEKDYCMKDCFMLNIGGMGNIIQQSHRNCKWSKA